MKSSRFVLPVALLSVAFMLGCAEQGSEVLGPQLKKDKPDDGGGDPTVAVVLADGMQASMEGVTVTEDSRRYLKLWNGPDNPVTVTLDFAVSYAQYLADPTSCITSPEGLGGTSVGDELADQFTREVSGPDSVYFSMNVDRRNLGEASDKHRLHVRYTDLDLGMVIVGYRSGGTTIARLVDGTDNVYEFTGLMRVWDKNESASEGVTLYCDVIEKVTVTVGG